MTVQNSGRFQRYSGTGTVYTYAFQFKVFSKTDLRVIRQDTNTGINTVLTLDSAGADGYTVSINANQDSSPGGSITVVTSPAVLTELFIYSLMDFVQPTVLTNQGGFYPEVVNDSLDRFVMGLQDMQSRVCRTLMVPVEETLNVGSAPNGYPLPRASERVNRYLAFDGTGQPIVADGTNAISGASSPVNLTLTANNAGANSGRDVVFQDNADETMRLTSDGTTARLGINVSTPVGVIDVVGPANQPNIRSRGATGSTFSIQHDSNDNTVLVQSAGEELKYVLGSTERLRINSLGQLQLLDNASYNDPVSTSGAVFAYDGTANEVNISAINTSGANALKFRTATGGTAFERMKISSAGLVTIGTTLTPGDLTVFTATSTGALSNAGVSIGNDGNTRQVNIGVDNTNSWGWIQSRDVSGAGYSPLALNPNGGDVVLSQPSRLSTGIVSAATAHSLSAATGYFIATAALTLTLPTASTYTGRSITVKTTAAGAITSATNNVVPLAGGAAGNAIVSATAGKWATLVSDGTNWVIMAAN